MSARAVRYRLVTANAVSLNALWVSGCGVVCRRLVLGSEVLRLRIESMIAGRVGAARRGASFAWSAWMQVSGADADFAGRLLIAAACGRVKESEVPWRRSRCAET